MLFKINDFKIGNNRVHPGNITKEINNSIIWLFEKKK